MRILILTDSLSLPRKFRNGNVEWEQIYPNLLRKRFSGIEVVHVAIGGATIADLYSQLNYYDNLVPDIVFLQSGIVDCAPRSLSRLELEVVKKFRLFRLVKPFFKFFRKYRGITYTSSADFKLYVVKISKRFPGSKVYSIGILPGCKEYDELVPSVSSKIVQYNQILKELTQFIDMSEIPRNCIIEDHHHMNARGHQYLFYKIAHILRKKIEEGSGVG